MTTSDLALNLLNTSDVSVDLARDQGPLETFRHSFGRGGINANPLSDRVIAGLASCQPRLIRVFLQEYFRIYPEHGVFDWSRMDPFMNSLAKTGAKVVASICLKPKPLYPKIDQNIWRPNDVKEWQKVVATMVKRYSIDKHIVTHWSVGNETDIGENGGCPFLIASPEDYVQYYKITIDAIRETWPQAKVGGPSVANAFGSYLPEILTIIHREKIPLDFIAWHVYNDDPDRHAAMVEKYKKLLEPFAAGGGKRPEMMVTECNKGFDRLSIEELAFEPRRAANIAAILIANQNAGLDWSFYYHFGDQVCYVPEFAEFFEKPEIMYHHWNEVPHRFGLFGVNEEARPQYFVYQLLHRMDEAGAARRVHATSDLKDLRLLASAAGKTVSLLLVNFGQPRSESRVAAIRLQGLTPGRKQLRVYRIDQNRTWCSEKLNLAPCEIREVDTTADFECQVYSPADSVTLLQLTP